MAFEYFADPSPPVLSEVGVTDPIGPWTNYGPKPPAVGVERVRRTTGARVKTVCSWCQACPRSAHRDGDCRSARSTVRSVEAVSARPHGRTLVPGSSMAIVSTPDLLRVRKVRVTLRVQVGAKRLRGPTGHVLHFGGGTHRVGLATFPTRRSRSRSRHVTSISDGKADAHDITLIHRWRESGASAGARAGRRAHGHDAVVGARLALILTNHDRNARSPATTRMGRKPCTAADGRD
jgi:hypothetical protein